MSADARPYKLSPLARLDLEDIWNYTSKTWSPDQADRYHNEIVAAIADLARGYRIGRPALIRDGYFKYAVGSHIVFYRQSALSLDVIRILHQRMDTPTRLNVGA